MKGFPYVTALVCVIVGAKYSDQVKDMLKDIPVVGDFLTKTSTSK
jgi:putative cell wall-binding protein